MSAAAVIDEYRGLSERRKRETAPVDPAIEQAKSRLLLVDVSRHVVVVQPQEPAVPKEYTWIAAAMAVAGLALLAAALWMSWGG